MDIGFIHFNSEEKNKVLKALQLIREQQAIDELGIGRVRDAFANKMFPGMSTLQQHAKYFVILPLLYKTAEKYHYNDFRDVKFKLTELEIKLTRQLILGSPENAIGITGSDVVKRNGTTNIDKYVKYDPNYIYSSGMRTYGILKTDAIEAAIFKMSKIREESPERYKSEKDEFGSDDDASSAELQYCVFPNETLDLSKPISIFLNKTEAEFLKSHILSTKDSKDSLLAYILSNNIAIGEDYEFLPADADYSGVITFDSLDYNIFPENFKKEITLAKRFSQFIYPLNMRFMVIYFEGTDMYENLKDSFNELLDRHRKLYDKDLIQEIFTFLKISDPSIELFCLKAIEYVNKEDMTGLDNLIVKREISVKGPKRAKLRNPNRTFDENYYKNLHMLDYRWSIVRRVINEIRKGEI
jgi:hypothetical protein